MPLNLFQCEFRKRTTRKENVLIESNEKLEFDDEDETDLSTELTTEIAAEDDTTTWIYCEENLQKLIENIQGEWTQANVK